jgi:methionyl-tRNA synthetase
LEADLLQTLGSEATTLLAAIESLPKIVDEHYESFNIYKGIDAIMSVLRHTNVLVQNTAPWSLAKSEDATDLQKLEHLLFLAFEALKVCGVLLSPVTPHLSAILLEKLRYSLPDQLDLAAFSLPATANSSRQLGQQKVTLFNRILLDTNTVKSPKG